MTFLPLLPFDHWVVKRIDIYVKLNNYRYFASPPYATGQHHLIPEVLKDVLKIMQSKEKDLSVTDKIIILIFDEIYILNMLDLELREQKI